MNLAHLLQRQALQSPERPAILEAERLHATHGQWADRAARLGAAMQAQGLQPGDRVLLFMRNHPRYLEFMFGCWWAGLVVVPVNNKLHLKEVQWIADNAQARWAFVTQDLVPPGDDLAGLAGVTEADSAQADAMLQHATALPAITERGADDTAWLFYTSGTTGRPKGVMITHRNLMTMGLGYFCDVDPIASDDAIVYAAPMSHGAGIYAIPHLMAGARHVVPASGGFDAAELFDLGLKTGPLSLFAAPTIVKRLVDEAEAAGHSPARCAQAFKTIVYGGAPMYAADIELALRVMGPRFVQIYGQGESPMTITVLPKNDIADRRHPRWRERLASAGRAFSCIELVIANERGLAFPQGEPGEIQIRGHNVMKGYWNLPEATAEAINADGWFATGDIARTDEDVYYYIVDRKKALIIRGGFNVYPREIEEVLYTHPAVAEAAVVGIPHDTLGEEVHARYADVKLASAERCPKALGSQIKTAEVQFHHEVTNQFLWNLF